MNHHIHFKDRSKRGPYRCFRTVIRLVCLTLALGVVLSGAAALSSCSAKYGTPLITLDGHSVTVNMYELLCSRAKANLARSGFTVSGSDFWDTVVAENGATADEYFRQTALQDAGDYLCALVLFDELGLSLPKQTTDDIDREIKELIDGKAGGSKTEFNAELSAYGVNADILREWYVIEAKYEAVIRELYGETGDKISAALYQQFVEENTVCFRFILFRSFGYEYETDTYGDEIYYIGSADGATSRIAYDTGNGTVRYDEYGQILSDKNGDSIYWLSDGRVAYDTETGVRSPVTDADGNAMTRELTAAETAANRMAVNAMVARGGEYFDVICEETAALKNDDVVVENSPCFLYKTANTGEELNDIADFVGGMTAGTVAQYESDYGVYLILRTDVPSDAVTDPSNAEWFSDLSVRVSEYLFAQKIAPYKSRIETDSDVYASAPSMKEIGANYNY